MSIYEVLDKVFTTKDFTVGGGSASAISGAMAAGLVGMVSRLSVGKGYGLSDETYSRISDLMDRVCQELSSGAQEDTKAFLGIKNAFALPKSTEEEKKIRSRAINDAAVQAATVPLENAKRAEKIMEACNILEGKCNPNASSDIMIGKMLAHVAIQGCVLNIEANLPLVKEQGQKETLNRSGLELIKNLASNPENESVKEMKE